MTTLTDPRAYADSREVQRRAFAPGLVLSEVETNAGLTLLAGRAVPYWTWADTGFGYLEQWAQGALDKSVTEAARGLPLLVWHNDRSWPIGLSKEWNSLPDGLHGVWSIDPDEFSQQAARKARSGSMGYLSIRFAPIRSAWTFAEDWNPDDPARMHQVTRQEARMIETSLLSTPTYLESEVYLVRGAPQREGSPRPAAVNTAGAAAPLLDAARAWRATIK